MFLALSVLGNFNPIEIIYAILLKNSGKKNRYPTWFLLKSAMRFTVRILVFKGILIIIVIDSIPCLCEFIT